MREAGFVHQPDTCCEWTTRGAAIGVNLSNSLEGYIQVVGRFDHLSRILSQGDIPHESREYDFLGRLASSLNPSAIVNDYSTPVFSDLLKAERCVRRT